MLRIKSCPRCVGDMFLESSPDGPEWVCVQCGHRHDAARSALTASPAPPRFSPTGRSQTDGWDMRFGRAMDRDLGVRTAA